MESDVEFAACDLPQANRFMLHIMAAVAENEGKAISERTIAALQAAKARGTTLGGDNPNSRNLTQEHRRKGAHAAKVKADAEYAPVADVIIKMHRSGLSLRQITTRLNDDGHATRRGRAWNPVQVSRVLKRFESIS